jgi:(p)ppGpp synthase/HD superfamily hydrolase
MGTTRMKEHRAVPNRRQRENALIERAATIALEAHLGHVDRYGQPMLLHALRVGLACETPVEIAGGFLHDAVEDNPLFTFRVLRERGMPRDVLRIVRLLTRRAAESTDAYIERICAHPAAVRVKLRDLEDNMDVRRADTLTESDAARFNRYRQAWLRLMDLRREPRKT